MAMGPRPRGNRRFFTRIVKIVLDEMMPKQFASYLTGHEVNHVVILGWRHVANGKLLTLFEGAGFEAFITKDGNLPYQQNITGRRIAVIILEPRTQEISDLVALAPQVLRLLPSLEAGSVSRVITP
jgi:hypothetical protein